MAAPAELASTVRSVSASASSSPVPIPYKSDHVAIGRVWMDEAVKVVRPALVPRGDGRIDGVGDYAKFLSGERRPCREI